MLRLICPNSAEQGLTTVFFASDLNESFAEMLRKTIFKKMFLNVQKDGSVSSLKTILTQYKYLYTALDFVEDHFCFSILAYCTQTGQNSSEYNRARVVCPCFHAYKSDIQLTLTSY